MPSLVNSPEHQPTSGGIANAGHCSFGGSSARFHSSLARERVPGCEENGLMGSSAGMVIVPTPVGREFYGCGRFRTRLIGAMRFKSYQNPLNYEESVWNHIVAHHLAPRLAGARGRGQRRFLGASFAPQRETVFLAGGHRLVACSIAVPRRVGGLSGCA